MGGYLFKLIVLFKSHFWCCKSFTSSWIDKVKSGTQGFVSFVFVSSFAVEITQLADQIGTRLISQFISDSSRVLKKLLNYFYGTAIAETFVLPLLRVLLVFLTLDLNSLDSVIAAWFGNGSSL